MIFGYGVPLISGKRQASSSPNHVYSSTGSMEQQAIEDYSDETRHVLLGIAGVTVEDVTDLNGFENFVYGTDDHVIRVSHESHRSEAQLLAELEFVSALAGRGAAVAAPVPLPDGQWLQRHGAFHVCRFERARGHRPAGFEARLVQQWGRCIGEFHRISAALDLKLERDDWLSDENHQFEKRIPPDQQEMHASAASTLAALKGLPQTADVFGLIHSDAHWGNFVVAGDRLTFFDFDDSLYCWFGYDLATILLGAMLQPWVPETVAAETRAVADFLDAFLAGYSEVAVVDGLMLEHMPLLIRLREFSLYAVIHAHANVGNNPFAQRFMRGRRERLERNQPFVELDFTRWA